MMPFSTVYNRKRLANPGRSILRRIIAKAPHGKPGSVRNPKGVNMFESTDSYWLREARLQELAAETLKWAHDKLKAGAAVARDRAKLHAASAKKLGSRHQREQAVDQLRREDRLKKYVKKLRGQTFNRLSKGTPHAATESAFTEMHNLMEWEPLALGMGVGSYRAYKSPEYKPNVASDVLRGGALGGIIGAHFGNDIHKLALKKGLLIGGYGGGRAALAGAATGATHGAAYGAIYGAGKHMGSALVRRYGKKKERQ